MRDINDGQLKEVAKMLNVKPTTAHMIQKRALEKFKKELGLDSILFGFGLDSDALHSPNEHYGVFNYYKGIETIPLFFKYFVDSKA